MRDTIDTADKPLFELVPRLARLRDLVRPFDPVASVYLRGGSSDAELRFRSLAAGLTRAGTPPETVDAVALALAERMERPAQLAAFAAGERVLATYELDVHDGLDAASWAAPAHVLPLLAWIVAHPPYVEVVVDRKGADLTAVPAGAVRGTTTTIVGPDDEIERNAPGGWSQPRYQRRAVDSWQHNAAAVADATARAVFDTRAELLLVAGDIRATHLMLARLPERPLLVRRVTGGRAPDGSEVARAAEVADARAAHAERSRAATQAVFRDAGPGTAVEGAEETLAALAAGRVRTLLVEPVVAATGSAWFGPEQLCTVRPDPAPDGSTPRRGTLVDVAVRAALLTDAHVCPAEAGTFPLADGIGALCRYG